MMIAGIHKTSLIDFPGKLCATLFTQGCNFACPFCHNRALWPSAAPETPYTLDDLRAFLRKRRGRLQAVCISGGEPTLHDDLPELIAEIRSLGYAVKLDTNGSHPDMLRSLLAERLLDYVAIDIKASEAKYRFLAGTPVDFGRILESVRCVECSGVAYQLRTTYVQPLLDEGDLAIIAALVADRSKYHVQPFRHPVLAM